MREPPQVSVTANYNMYVGFSRCGLVVTHVARIVRSTPERPPLQQLYLARCCFASDTFGRVAKNHATEKKIETVLDEFD